MKLYRTTSGSMLEHDGRFFQLDEQWDELVNRTDLVARLKSAMTKDGDLRMPGAALAPIGAQEVWAAGVTYLRSRAARIEESEGGGTFYDLVYSAERPELFFKAAGWRVRGPDESIRVRRDAKWNVPEPELALYINARREIIGYTIGNDVSSRDIEGENPLYLPQAKVYDGSCALGPAVLIIEEPLPADTRIELRITRAKAAVFDGSTTLAQLRRTPAELVEYLYREMAFPQGCVLLTGTGVIPPDDFTLATGDVVEITIAPIGTLRNTVA